MPLFGSHLSVAGGFYKAAEAAAELGFDTVQIFTNSPSQWSVPPVADDEAAARGGKGKKGKSAETGQLRELKPLAEADIARFRERREALGLVKPVSHASYLINLASPKDDLWRRSIAALAVELRRAKQLDLIGVVVHPGAFLDSTEAEGIARVAKGIDEVLALAGKEAAPILLENTAGQGSTLGWRFEQLGQMIEQARRGGEVGVCIDTCHSFAAGYELRTAAGYAAAFDELEQCVGIARVKAIHLNDSKKDLGSRVDRHEHIGHGHMGLEPFRLLLNDRRFAEVPMYLETAKEDCDGEPWDSVNLRTLKGLMKP